MRIRLVYAVMVTALCLSGVACQEQAVVSTPTLEEIQVLISILETPDSADFAYAADRLAQMGPSAAPSASALARALRYPRRDSYMAGRALVSIGREAETAVPLIAEALIDERSDVRLYAALALGSVGESAGCTVPQLAALLWDTDAWVRTASAAALEQVTGIDLVLDHYEINPLFPAAVAADTPEGSVTGTARGCY